MIIKIVREKHYIEGDRYFAYLQASNSDELICIARNIKPEGFLQMCEKLDGLRFRLSELDNYVEAITEVREDPNFETQADAEEYLNNKGA